MDATKLEELGRSGVCQSKQIKAIEVVEMRGASYSKDPDGWEVYSAWSCWLARPILLFIRLRRSMAFG